MRRLLIRVALVAALVAISFVMYDIGKERNVLLDNKSASIDGVEYEALVGVSIIVDGGKKTGVRPDARIAHKMVGRTHTIRLEISEGGKSIERTVRLTMNMKSWMISLPALAGGARDIYIPRPAAAQPLPPPSPSGEPETPALGDDGPGESLMGI
jgi:hypothetical protein